MARCGSCRFGGVYSRAGCSGHHCRSKGLCLRSPARRLTRPLASATVRVFASTGLGEFRRPGGEQVLRLRARDGEFRAPARVTFFFCKKKVTKENHLDLRFKDPLARYGSCKIGGADLAELVRRVSLSVRGTACTSCAAAADNSEGRGWYAGRVAIIKSRLCRLAAAKVGVPDGHRI